MHRARATAANADLCLWILDGSASPVESSEPLTAIQPVINKTDLSADWDWDAVTAAVRVSARTGAGLPELCAAIVARLVPDPPVAGAAVPFTPRLLAGLAEAQRVLAAGRVADAQQIVTELRQAP